MPGYMKMISKGAKMASAGAKAFGDAGTSDKGGATVDFQKVMQKFRPKKAAKPASASGKYDAIG